MPKLLTIINCPNCKYEGPSKFICKGSFRVEVALWLCAIAPGFVYSVWRRANQVHICPKCRYEYVVQKGHAYAPPTLLETLFKTHWKTVLGIISGGLGILYLFSIFSTRIEQHKVATPMGLHAEHITTPTRTYEEISASIEKLVTYPGFMQKEIEDLTATITEKGHQLKIPEDKLSEIIEKIIIAYKLETIQADDTPKEKQAVKNKINNLMESKINAAIAKSITEIETKKSCDQIAMEAKARSDNIENVKKQMDALTKYSEGIKSLGADTLKFAERDFAENIKLPGKQILELEKSIEHTKKMLSETVNIINIQNGNQ